MTPAAEAFHRHIERMRALQEALAHSAATTPSAKIAEARREQAAILEHALTRFMEALALLQLHPSSASALLSCNRRDSLYIYAECLTPLSTLCEPGGTDLIATHTGYVQAFLDAPEKFVGMIESP